MPKERTVNPAEAQRKAEKAKAIKKGMHSCSLSWYALTLEKEAIIYVLVRTTRDKCSQI
jgi:hypothetical protein